jgi:molecular chaperone GrpE
MNENQKEKIKENSELSKDNSSQEHLNDSSVVFQELNIEELKKKIEEFEKKIEELERENHEYKDKFLRKAAEFENYKRRIEQEVIEIKKYAAESFIKKVLKIYDDFERSLKYVQDKNSNLDSLVEGIKLIKANFDKLFEEEGIKRIETIGKPFDHRYHEALMQTPNEDFPPNTVIAEHEAGYIYKDKVVRYAKVIVSSEKENEA